MTSELTVIVVGFNHAKYFAECLESIRTQSLSADAVLVMDDASRDDSRSIVAEYSKAHPNFLRFFPSESNKGLTKTLNDALSHVNTKYVTYIAADDCMLPGRIEAQVELMRVSSAQLTYCDAVVIDAESNRVHDTSRLEFPWPDEPERSVHVLASLFAANWIPAASIMMQTEELRRLGGYNDRIFFEDFELLTRAAAAGWHFAYDERALVAVRRLDTSLGAVGFAGKSPRFILAMEAALRNFPIEPSELSRRVLAKRWELAKRTISTELPRRTRIEMTVSARGGAGSHRAFLYHLVRAIVAPRGRGG